ncbi:putative quinol monooxygenase [Pararhodobacter marinus]|uniref:putative quinol monooxygenase n=1 Tax=Pararhodobacter marinus TaxID=2184063 RepID=UPI003510DB7B
MSIRLTGKLICATEAQAALVREYLPEHVRLTLAEPGCLEFEVSHAGAMTWDVTERFTDRAAFEAHQARTGASAWGQATAGIAREYEVREG